jgi:hypothetical protein
MPCILKITGENFDVDNFVKKSNITPYKLFHKGDPKLATKPNSNKMEQSGCAIEISNVDFESFSEQLDDASTYLNKNREKLQWINKTPEIQYAVLDFGLNCDSDKFVQSHYLPNEFLKLVSRLSIGIEISVYHPIGE